MNPKSMSYSLNVKRYLANPRMKCVIATPSLENELAGEENQVGDIIMPLKEVDPKISRYMMVAIRQKRVLSMTYQSKSSDEPEKREIYPHAFGHDGVRYHVRAWCPKNEEYRDFSLLRVTDIKWPEKPVEEELPVDKDWEEFTEVRVKVNKAVSEGTRRALMEDYGLTAEDEDIIIKCRKAMKGYVLYRMGLDAESGLSDVPFFQTA